MLHYLHCEPAAKVARAILSLGHSAALFSMNANHGPQDYQILGLPATTVGSLMFDKSEGADNRRGSTGKTVYTVIFFYAKVCFS